VIKYAQMVEQTQNTPDRTAPWDAALFTSHTVMDAPTMHGMPDVFARNHRTPAKPFELGPWRRPAPVVELLPIKYPSPQPEDNQAITDQVEA